MQDRGRPLLHGYLARGNVPVAFTRPRPRPPKTQVWFTVRQDAREVTATEASAEASTTEHLRDDDASCLLRPYALDYVDGDEAEVAGAKGDADASSASETPGSESLAAFTENDQHGKRLRDEQDSASCSAFRVNERPPAVPILAASNGRYRAVPLLRQFNQTTRPVQAAPRNPPVGCLATARHSVPDSHTDCFSHSTPRREESEEAEEVQLLFSQDNEQGGTAGTAPPSRQRQNPLNARDYLTFRKRSLGDPYWLERRILAARNDPGKRLRFGDSGEHARAHDCFHVPSLQQGPLDSVVTAATRFFGFIFPNEKRPISESHILDYLRLQDYYSVHPTKPFPDGRLTLTTTDRLSPARTQSSPDWDDTDDEDDVEAL